MKYIMLNRYEKNIDNQKSLRQILFPTFGKGGLDTINGRYFNSEILYYIGIKLRNDQVNFEFIWAYLYNLIFLTIFIYNYVVLKNIYKSYLVA